MKITSAKCLHIFLPLQVYDRVQKLYLCLSNKATIRTIDKFGANYDEPVMKWRDRILQGMTEVIFVLACLL